jgi:hypothetical protein
MNNLKNMKKMQVSPYQIDNGKWRIGGIIIDGADFTEYDSLELFETNEEAKNFIIDLCKKEKFELEIK